MLQPEVANLLNYQTAEEEVLGGKPLADASFGELVELYHKVKGRLNFGESSVALEEINNPGFEAFKEEVFTQYAINLDNLEDVKTKIARVPTSELGAWVDKLGNYIGELEDSFVEAAGEKLTQFREKYPKAAHMLAETFDTVSSIVDVVVQRHSVELDRKLYGEEVATLGDAICRARNQFIEGVLEEHFSPGQVKVMEAAAFLGAVVVPQESGVSLKPFAHILNKIGGRGLYRNRASKVLKSLGYQEHHIISNKNDWTKDHELLKLAGFNLDSRSNKMFLPKSPGMHPSRSIHNGKHWDAISEDISIKMKSILEQGKLEQWTQEMYRTKFNNLLMNTRKELKSGKTILNSKGMK